LKNELRYMKSKKINENQKRDFRFEVANLITEVRYHYNLTQVQLAKKMKTKQPSIARMESGNTLPSLSFLEHLADSIGTYLVAPKFGFMAEENVPVMSGILEQKSKTRSRDITLSEYFQRGSKDILFKYFQSESSTCFIKN